ncbi:leucine--tRNA ligase [Halobacteriales archaeon SW_7_65_23]|nr:MAG: leucine--tRNA ligase [Halobacteriales archaeon SW_7_65_23]
MAERRYDQGRVKEYWQYVWDREDVYELDEDASDPTYVLGMFPYTSGNLHMGHVRNYTITDAYARYRRMQGDDVLHPMGWDAFGLPAENAAYERRTDPRAWTQLCIDRMREGMESLGFGYDWSREITTCEPSYYRWNQHFFRQFYEAGLVEYEAATVNWCPDCETVLADAQVVEAPDGHRESADDGEPFGGSEVCWRCETPVETRELDQWFFTITDYAEELLAGLDDLDGWPDSVREIQRNWIGKQEGAQVTFDVEGPGVDSVDAVDVFTTRLDTIAGATYLAVSPEHDLAERLAAGDDDVAAFLETARAEDNGEVVAEAGIETDATAVNPLTGEQLPVYVASYVLDDVGYGAVMGVPAHNERDHEFATEHDIPMTVVVEPADGSAVDVGSEPFTDDGILAVDSDLDGVASGEARERLLSELDAAAPEVTYRLRDWLISRQRYWGTPIPIVHCDDCGPVLVPESDLPIELPEYVQTTGNPLAESEAFVKTICPECGAPAERETDTMDTFVDSSWYFLRFLSPDLDDAPFDSKRANDWLPIDVYVGGEEHAILHLLYIRFFTRALADIGLLDVREPVRQLINQGTVLHGGQKMSKTGGNVVSPHEYGAETTRLFVLSAAHPQQDFEWTARSVSSAYDLQQQLYDMTQSFVERAAVRDGREPHDEYVAREIDRTVAAVTADYERFRFHRAVSEIRTLAGLVGQYREYDTPNETVYRRGLRVLARLIAPMAPFLGEEMWNLLRGDGPVATAAWPEPESAVERADLERSLVETLRKDVREICDVASIDDPATIEVVVAPDWKFRVHETVRTSDETDAVVGEIMSDKAMQQIGAPVQEFATALQAENRTLQPVLSADEEVTLLDRAAWLLRDEFDTAVTVRQADRTGDEAAKAAPGKPAIYIE